MGGTHFWRIILIFYGFLPSVEGQGVSEGSLTIFDALTRSLDCGKFQAVIINGGLDTESLYKSTLRLTLFLPNNTAFDLANPTLRNQIISLTGLEAADYVKSFTAVDMIEASSIRPDMYKDSLAGGGNRLFFYQRQRRAEDIVNPGNAGRTEYFVNGALILNPDVRALNGIIHILDRLLPPSSSKRALSYLQIPNSQMPTTSTKFYELLLRQIDTEDYQSTTFPLSGNGPLTLFLPTDQAINEIPPAKLSNLQGQKKELARVIKQHFIVSRALYMSFIYHNEGFLSQQGTQVTFRKNIYEKYYVSSGGVTAEITGNLTVYNGVIHFVDKILGFVYYSAMEQVVNDPQTSQFENLLNRGRKDLRDFMVVPAGVTVFVPTDSAFQNLQNLPGVDLYNDQSLINRVLELCMLERGTVFPVTQVFGDYSSRLATPSQYRNYDIQVYSQGNETWAEGGYVKARVIRPDVGTTNGMVHYIDGVFGVPSRDLPSTVYCEDWLLVTSYFLGITGINTFTKDHSIRSSPPACPDSDYRRSISFGSNTQVNQVTPNTLGASSTATVSQALPTLGCTADQPRCEFTMFVPNGTAMEFFQLSRLGRAIMADSPRFQYVMRRHIVLNEKIYLDQRAIGYHSFISHTGEEIRFKKDVSGSRVFYSVFFKGRMFTVLHADIGATNGVIHILDDVIYQETDLTINISWNAATGNLPSWLSLVLAAALCFLRG